MFQKKASKKGQKLKELGHAVNNKIPFYLSCCFNRNYEMVMIIDSIKNNLKSTLLTESKVA